ncbi:MAG: LPS export ABC transporter permease LptF [Xylophilus ampelinus]
MLFHSSIRKELGRSFGATLVVLSTVVVTILLIRVLGQASRGNVNPSDVLLVMGYTVLGQLPIILALSLFIAIVGTLSRMFRDSEMAIWFAAGRGLGAFLPPMLRFAWPVLGVIAVLSLMAWPWANTQIQELRNQYERRGDIDRVAPGQFQESANGNRVFFIDRDSPNAQTASSVFIATFDPGRETVTSARNARLETINGDRFVVLSNGQRLENTAAQPAAKLSEFREYGGRVGTAAAALADADATPLKAVSTAGLLADPTPQKKAELAWRIGLAIAGLNFVLLALAISNVNPRAGRSGSMLTALFAFVLYFNFLNLGQNWVGTGRVSFGGFLLMLHGGVALLAALLLAKRHNQWSWSFRRRVPSPARAAA